MNEKFNLYCDMDGVLVDFERGIKDGFDLEFPKTWIPEDEFKKFHDDLFDKISNLGVLFWEDLFPLDDCYTLWNHIKQYNPSILTAYPSNITDTYTKDRCKLGKRRWVRDMLDVNETERFNISYAIHKHHYVDPIKPSILIDDRKSNIENWISAGGIGILHTSADDTIKQLSNIIKDLG